MRRSHQTNLVFQALLDAPAEETYGFELARATGLPGGTVYPILQKLVDNGLLTTRWEEIEESAARRRRRRYYRLTADGARAARATTAPTEAGLRVLMPGWGAT